MDVALILDPMLATGGSAVDALTTLRDWGVPHVKLLSLIAAEEGVKRVELEFPEFADLCLPDRSGFERSQVHRARPGRRGRSDL